MSPPQPGTYRILSVATNTAITSSSSDWWGIVSWHKEDTVNQKWYVQHSGEGYRIKSVRTGNYLAAASAVDTPQLYCGRYPTTWVLVPDLTSHNTYLMQIGDTDRVLDLDDYGAGHDGNRIHALPQHGHWHRWKLWFFERIGDDTGDNEVELKKELAAKKSELAAKEREVSEKVALLGESQSRLSQTQEALARAESLLKTREVELEQLRQENMTLRVEKQKQDTEDLRTKLERLELVVSTMAQNQQSPRPNNLT